MKSHRTIWTITGIIAALALLVLALRLTRDQSEAIEASRFVTDQRDQAIADMMQALRLDPRVRLESTQRHVEAVAAYADEPGLATAEIYYALGLRRFYGNEDYSGAEEAFREAIALRPNWSWPHNALGIVLFTAGHRDRALDAFNRAMELNPEWSRPHSDLAILYRRAGDLEAALEEVRKAVELDPDGLITQYNYGVILDYVGRERERRGQPEVAERLYDEAKERYEAVLQLVPDLPWPHYNLACGYARNGELAPALDHLRAAIRLEQAFREEAKKDPDFDPIRDTREFQNLVYNENAA